jgi:hypothetical protein
MSLSSRWSFFSKDVKEEEEKQEKDNDNGDEVVFTDKKEDEKVNTEGGHGNTDEGLCENDKYNVVNKYLKSRNTANDVVDETNTNGCNSHYKGIKSELMATMPVLYIEEYVPIGWYNDNSKNLTDWRAYIYYDVRREVYVLNGTRRRSDENNMKMERKFPDVCMTFKSKSSLAFYLRKSMCSWKHRLSVTMYSMYRNVIHLSTCGAMPSFHSIHHCRNKFRNELFGYDDCHVSLKEFESYLKVLKDCADDGYLFRPMTNTI